MSEFHEGFLKRCSHRFVQSLMVEYEILVLLPGSDEIVRDSMEDLAVNFSLRGEKVLGVIQQQITTRAYVMNSTRHPDLLPKFVRNWVLKSMGVDLRSRRR